MSAHILVADDEKELADMLELYLTNDGHTVHKAYTAAEALDCAASTDLDLAVLDVMFPDGSGFQICKKIREKHCYPIIMLTAKSAASDKILGLTIGADDYITKPFNPLEVAARVKTQLRRYRQYNHSAGLRQKPHMNMTSAASSSTETTTSAFFSGRSCSSPPLNFQFSGISANVREWLSPRKSCLRRYGGRNSCKTTTPSWRTSGGCGKSWPSLPEIRGS